MPHAALIEKARNTSVDYAPTAVEVQSHYFTSNNDRIKVFLARKDNIEENGKRKIERQLDNTWLFQITDLHCQVIVVVTVACVKCSRIQSIRCGCIFILLNYLINYLLLNKQIFSSKAHTINNSHTYLPVVKLREINKEFLHDVRFSTPHNTISNLHFQLY